jgi:GT2 family glycosyltransferase
MGFTEARTDAPFVLFLDHDDLLHADALEALCAGLDDRTAVAAYGLPRDVDASGAPLTERVDQAFGFDRLGIANGRVYQAPPHVPATFDMFVVWDMIATPGQVLIRRSALQEVGSFDPVTVPSDDWDLWARLSLLGHLRPLLRFVVDKRIHASNQSAGKGLKGAGHRMRLKLATMPVLSAEQQRLVQLGHGHGTALRLRWARAAVGRRDLMATLRFLRQAVIAWLEYKSVRY